jgi:endonuclease-3 related protein
MRREPLGPLRREVRSLPGLDAETTDTLLLYGAGRPVFVADSSVRRVLVRHRLLPARVGYEDARQFVESHLPLDPVLLKEYHALLTSVAGTYCGPVPRCRSCPLRPDLDGKRPAG